MQQTQQGGPTATTDSPESRFADRMSVARKALGMSQRDLAVRLQAEGLALDPSAITRLEKGQREIKLGEAATIARVLGVSLTEMAGLDGPPPTAALVRLRAEANGEMHSARRALVSSLQAFYAVQQLLRVSPDLLEQLGDQKNPPPDSVDDYLEWVRKRVLDVARDWNVVPVESAEDRDAINALARALVSRSAYVMDEQAFFGPRAMLEGLDGEHPQA